MRSKRKQAARVAAGRIWGIPMLWLRSEPCAQRVTATVVYSTTIALPHQREAITRGEH